MSHSHGTPDPQPSEPQPLDDEHVLEPVDPQRPDRAELPAPMVRDAAGRVWKLRRRKQGWPPLAVALAVALLAAAVAWLIIASP
jgi:hypothetical protein